MTKEVSVKDMSRQFSEIMNRVTYKGEHFLLRRGNRVVAELRPAPAGGRLGDLSSLLSALPKLSHQESNAFARDLKKLKKELQRHAPKTPWVS